MRILQIGGGSMGTRRMRDLSALRAGDDAFAICLFDERADRRAAAAERFGIDGVADFDSAMAFDPDALVVSTPPHLHSDYVAAALERGLHVFCEADIWPFDVDAVRRARQQHPGLVAAPSATLRFQPLIREVARIVRDEMGTVHAFGYLLSVDAPSWHPGEGSEYYARHRATAPAREMTAFELIALQQIFGPAQSVSGLVLRRGTLDGDTEDTFALQYRTQDGAAGQLTVVMAAPEVARRGWVSTDAGVLHFDLLAGTIERRRADGTVDNRVVCDWSATLEDVYRDEIATFIAATQGRATWPYSYAESALVCATLAAAEMSSVSGRAEPVYEGLSPAAVPGLYPEVAGTRS